MPYPARAAPPTNPPHSPRAAAEYAAGAARVYEATVEKLTVEALAQGVTHARLAGHLFGLVVALVASAPDALWRVHFAVMVERSFGQRVRSFRRMLAREVFHVVAGR